MMRLIFTLILTLTASLAGTAQDNVTYMDIHPQWSPDGRKIVYYRVPSDFSESWINVIDVAKGDEITAYSGGHFNSNPVWHPSGEELLFASARPSMRGDWQLYRHNLLTDEQVAATQANGRVGHPFWSPDSQTLVYQKRVSAADQPFATDVFLLDMQTGEETRITETEENEFHPKFSRDGRYVVFDAGDRASGHIVRFDMHTKETDTLIAPQEGMRAGVPSFSPDGAKIVYSKGPVQRDAGPTNLYIRDLATGIDTQLTGVPASKTAGGASWSPDGSKIAFHISEGREASLWVVGADGKGLRALK
ncbi:MAG: PD40 domain-containing protein [Kordiimonadaceae bacterium]|nr:PD40 domain-containing protein [Kordiimonadaceae bacterium]MBO6567129.1 PD40 domain-containing protein [Kordiimonadaceae bacterium]MBO6963656.1 PD40 domain-containing protein [Kordiimonadaceae bacterium]